MTYINIPGTQSDTSIGHSLYCFLDPELPYGNNRTRDNRFKKVCGFFFWDPNLEKFLCLALENQWLSFFSVNAHIETFLRILFKRNWFSYTFELLLPHFWTWKVLGSRFGFSGKRTYPNYY